MNRDIITEAIQQHLASHNHHVQAAGFSATNMNVEKAQSVWNQITNDPRIKAIPWTQLLSILGPILNMIFAGNPIGAIIAQILAILNPPAPVPPAPPAA